jgi:acetyl-CoA synthetase
MPAVPATGDLGVQDEDGYFWYVSREDDVITTAGYRVGPSEIEHTLMKHPAVAMSAVVGIPDPIRTESIKAWSCCGRASHRAMRWRARSRISSSAAAAHEYPRFAVHRTLPMTATGKVLRRNCGRCRRATSPREAPASAGRVLPARGGIAHLY